MPVDHDRRTRLPFLSSPVRKLKTFDRLPAVRASVTGGCVSRILEPSRVRRQLARLTAHRFAVPSIRRYGEHPGEQRAATGTQRPSYRALVGDPQELNELAQTRGARRSGPQIADDGHSERVMPHPCRGNLPQPLKRLYGPLSVP